jgi:hypothetical protein
VSEEEVWRYNYFNYFTEVEEHFQRARGTGLFLMSPLDWALLESWKNSGVPLPAVLRGIDEAFAKWHARKRKTQMVNSIAYCTQEVLTIAQAMAGGSAPTGASAPPAEAPFSLEAVRKHLSAAAARLRQLSTAGFAEVAAAIEAITTTLEEHFTDLEQLDLRLTALEDKLAAITRASLSDEALLGFRRQLDGYLRPYRGKMTADQLDRLERSFLDRQVFEHANLPRLSLFYIRP